MKVTGSNPVSPTTKTKGGYNKVTKEQILALKRDRLNKLAGTPKNIKSGGVVRKLTRTIRNLNK